MMAFEQLMAQAVYLACRVGGYALLNLVEAPALLAIIFCGLSNE